MKLYKNVDIQDLEKILKKGILPMNITFNNNWNGSRANNSKDVVYLFSPLTEKNTFEQYGLALLEIEIDVIEVKENEMVENDVNKNMYIEYIAEKVNPQNITKIYIPKMYKKRVQNILPKEIFGMIEFVEITGEYYNLEKGWKKASKKVIDTLKTAPLDADDYVYFLGKGENGLINFRNIIYKGI